jgi:predicted nucleotide-binding protein (sugar kinase/HSP70/actin superfamily)
MTSIAIPNLGNYSLAFASLFRAVGAEVWTSTCATPESLALGFEAAPESACVPFKMYMGHFLQASREGVDCGVMVNSKGSCRLSYYARLHEQILKNHGSRMRFFSLGYDGIKPPLFRHLRATLPASLRGAARMWNKLHAVDGIELAAWSSRARELRRGDTTRLMNVILAELDRAETVREIRALRQSIANRFGAIAADRQRAVLRIGLVGEAAVLRDRLLNQDIEETLGGLGVEVRNFFRMAPELDNIFGLGPFNEYTEKRQLALARPYVTSLRVGGHSLDSVANTVRCARAGYDGVIHLCPTGCMPEVSVRPILRQIGRDLRLAVMEISIDEHTSRVGVATRLEAFVDVLQQKADNKTRSGSLHEYLPRH